MAPMKSEGPGVQEPKLIAESKQRNRRSVANLVLQRQHRPSWSSFVQLPINFTFFRLPIHISILLRQPSVFGPSSFSTLLICHLQQMEKWSYNPVPWK